MSKAKRKQEAIRRGQQSRAKLMTTIGFALLIIGVALSAAYLGMRPESPETGTGVFTGAALTRLISEEER